MPRELRLRRHLREYPCFRALASLRGAGKKAV
jgi:hypothetical protein